MTTGFDIIAYMGSMTGYSFERSVLEAIALKRGVADVGSYGELGQRREDLLRADMLFYIYTSPTQSASESASHGDFSRSRGTQSITDKRNIYRIMMGLYRKWGEDPMGGEDPGGVCEWVEG